MFWQACAALNVLILVFVSVKGDDGSRLVQLAQGAVRGYKTPGDNLFIFYNIPYASAPTGRDKFKAPLPPPVWANTLDAVDRGIVCPQTDTLLSMGLNKTVTEDCLIANIYVPDTNDTNLPVVTIAHGGAYQVGFGGMYAPSHLARSKKIITVTYNYRLGSHGFLCLGTESAPGNAGMKDQVALLRWVKANIGAFGGNPDDVTISGFSAGSSAVDLIMLSESANGLFTKVIAESGNSLNAFSVQNDPLLIARDLAKQMNFENVDDFNALEEFYTTAPIDVLTSYAYLDGPDSTFTFSPCVERDVGQEIFLNDAPINILRSGNYNKVPLLYGFADLEGLMRAPFFEIWTDRMNERFSDFLPADLNFDSDTQKEEVAQRVKQFYFGAAPVNEDNGLAFIDYFSDVLFTYGILKAVQLHIEAGHNQVYLYEYSYVPEDLPLWRNLTGADHCDQTAAVYDGYKLMFVEEELSEDYLRFKEVMRDLWWNFITTGAPVTAGSGYPAWPPVNTAWSPHMSLNGTLELRGSLLQERTQFWDQIYQQHYRAPTPPSSNGISLKSSGALFLMATMNILHLFRVN